MVCHVGLGIVEAMYSPGIPLSLSYFSPREKVRSEDGYLHFRLCVGDCVRRGSGLRDRSGKMYHRALADLVHFRGRADWPAGGVGMVCSPGWSNESIPPKGRDRDIAIEHSLRQPGDKETTGL
jgi:hypothetical protein